MLFIGNRDDVDLVWCQPGWEGSLVDFGQVGHEAFHGADHPTVDHDWAVLLTVFTNVVEVKLFRQHEVQLDGGHRFVVAQGGLGLDVQLWSVEGRFPFGFVVVQPHGIHGGL